jgi:putative ABC transport system permease protein
MADFGADLRQAWRAMRQRPGLSILMIVTLAVGLAANASIFSVLDSLVLRPIDLPEVDRLVMVWESAPGEESFERSNVAPANFLDWRAGSAWALSHLAALEWWGASVGGDVVLERVEGFKVSASFFELLGVRPAQGRGFLPDEERPGQERSVVLGHTLWQRNFGSDPGILGRMVVIDGQPYTVVGVAPDGFDFPMGSEIWAPLVVPAAGAAPRDQHYWMSIGRLAPGRTLEQARARLEVIAAQLAQEHPTTNGSRSVVVSSLQGGMEDPGAGPVLAVWQAAAFFVLLVACVNVANLALARGAERRRELAVRAALGAGPGRIVRQLATEGLLLALCSAIGSIPLAWWATRELRDFMPAEIARFVAGFDRIGVDGRSLAFTAVLAILAAALFSAWPALRVARPQLTDVLRDGDRGAGVGLGRQRGRSALVVVEIACALALLVTGGMAVRAAAGMIGGPQGYDPERLLTLHLTMPEETYPEPERRAALARTALERMAALPGVRQASFATHLPATGANSSRAIRLEGEALADPSDPPQADARWMAAGHLETLGIPLLRGRAFTQADDAAALPVAIVSRSMAERFWPGLDPIGRRFQAGDEDAPMLTVVGVCGDVIHHWFSRRNYPTFYRPFEQDPRYSITFALRTEGEPEGLATVARQALRQVAPDLPAYDVRSMRRSIRLSTIGLSYGAAIMSVFALLALILALSGVYGVMSYRVSLRTAEIGLRVALGATSRDVLRMTLGQAAILCGFGLMVGLGLAAGLSRAMSAAFMGAVSQDALVSAALGLLLAVAAIAAAYLPARRALEVDPAEALRVQ